MQKKYPHCFSYLIDMGEVWAFRICYTNKDWKTESALLHYVRRETLELIHSEELAHPDTILGYNGFAPHLFPSYHVEIDNKNAEMFKDFFVYITTLSVSFSLREVSLHFLL